MIETVGDMVTALRKFPANAKLVANTGAECGIDNACEIESLSGTDAEGNEPENLAFVTTVSIRVPEKEGGE